MIQIDVNYPMEEKNTRGLEIRKNGHWWEYKRRDSGVGKWTLVDSQIKMDVLIKNGRSRSKKTLKDWKSGNWTLKIRKPASENRHWWIRYNTLAVDIR